MAINFVPGVNVRNLVKQVTSGGDQDVFDGISVRGGARTTNGSLIGRTQQVEALGPNYAANPGSAQPTASDPYSATGGGGGGAARAASNQAAIAQFDQGINNVNSALGRLTGQADIGNRNIDTGYNEGLNQLNQSKALQQQAYDQNVTTNRQDYVGNKNSINVNTGNSLNSLMRLLGSKGAGGSSAAGVASEAAARQGTLQRQGAGDAFGKNAQALDTNWNNYLNEFKGSVDGLGRQRDNQKNALQANIENTRANLLQQLAQLSGQRASAAGGNAVASAQPFLDQANTSLARVDTLGLQAPVYQVDPARYTAPELAQYTANPNAAPTVNGQAAGQSDYATPFLSLLLGNRREQANPFGV